MASAGLAETGSWSGAVAADAHQDAVHSGLAEVTPAMRARRAAEELQRLEDERGDFTAIRDVAIRPLANSDGSSYAMVAPALNLAQDRAAQLVRRANAVPRPRCATRGRLKRQAAQR